MSLINSNDSFAATWKNRILESYKEDPLYQFKLCKIIPFKMAQEFQALNQLAQILWEELKLRDSAFNLYERLEISPLATPAEIKKAARTARLAFHPDKNHNIKGKELKEYEAKFDSVNYAYGILRNPRLKEIYDIFLSNL